MVDPSGGASVGRPSPTVSALRLSSILPRIAWGRPFFPNPATPFWNPRESSGAPFDPRTTIQSAPGQGDADGGLFPHSSLNASRLIHPRPPARANRDPPR